MEKPKAEDFAGIALFMCAMFGVVAGLIGLGSGLIFLNDTQAFGLGVLSLGLGMLFGGVFGVRAVVRLWVRQLEQELKQTEEFDKPPITRPAQAESISGKAPVSRPPESELW